MGGSPRLPPAPVPVLPPSPSFSTAEKIRKDSPDTDLRGKKDRRKELQRKKARSKKSSSDISLTSILGE